MPRAEIAACALSRAGRIAGFEKAPFPSFSFSLSRVAIEPVGVLMDEKLEALGTRQTPFFSLPLSSKTMGLHSIDEAIISGRRIAVGFLPSFFSLSPSPARRRRDALLSRFAERRMTNLAFSSLHRNPGGRVKHGRDPFFSAPSPKTRLSEAARQAE